MFAEKRNLAQDLLEQYQHPQEDYLIASEELGVFVVSDGVTLNFSKLIEKNEKYPNPSPAGDVARIFCESVFEKAKELNGNNEPNAVEIFKYANDKVAEYNRKAGKTEICGNPTGYFAATGSFAIIKNSKAYWASICDAYIAHFGQNMNSKFMTSGLCQPYAVVNGEERMAEHLEKGVLNLEKDDRFFVFTDGFEFYMQNSEFLDLFKTWDDTLQKRITEFSQKANLQDPDKYGHERSIIGILI